MGLSQGACRHALRAPRGQADARIAASYFIISKMHAIAKTLKNQGK
jgi:hypothetical protein